MKQFPLLVPLLLVSLDSNRIPPHPVFSSSIHCFIFTVRHTVQQISSNLFQIVFWLSNFKQGWKLLESISSFSNQIPASLFSALQLQTECQRLVLPWPMESITVLSTTCFDHVSRSSDLRPTIQNLNVGRVKSTENHFLIIPNSKLWNCFENSF